MDLRTLRYCEAVARLGSITRAAETLHVAQPALSTAIKKLEDELGVRLFVRQQNKPVAPTAEGRILLKRAERLFQEVDSARRELADAQGLRTGEVRIGMPPMYGLSFFPPVMTAFSARYPGIAVTAVEGSAGEVGGMLDSGEIDLAVLESRRIRTGWRHAVIGEEEIVLVVHRGHPLAAKTKVSAADLDGLRMVVLDESFLQRNVLDKRCQKSGARYRIVMQSNYVPLAVEATVAGLGAATLTRSMIRPERGMVALGFTPAETFRFNLCWLDDRYLSTANRAFRDFVLEGRGDGDGKTAAPKSRGKRRR